MKKNRTEVRIKDMADNKWRRTRNEPKIEQNTWKMERKKKRAKWMCNTKIGHIMIYSGEKNTTTASMEDLYYS